MRLRLTPKAAKDAVNGVMADENGDAVLKVTVTVPPEDGKANARMIRLLARTWKVPKSAFRVDGGATARNKILFVEDLSGERMAHIIDWMEHNL